MDGRQWIRRYGDGLGFEGSAKARREKGRGRADGARQAIDPDRAEFGGKVAPRQDRGDAELSCTGGLSWRWVRRRRLLRQGEGT